MLGARDGSVGVALEVVGWDGVRCFVVFDLTLEDICSGE